MKQDGRKIDHKALEFIRINSAKRIAAGESPAKVMASFGLCRTTWYKWAKKITADNLSGLASSVHPGPTCKLSEKQKSQIRTWICGKDPRQYGIDFGLWTRQIVAELILKNFKITLSLATIGKILDELNITPRKPLQRAYQRDPESIAKWIKLDYPSIKAEAKREYREICFIDEAGFTTDDTRGTTYGIKGERTVIVTDGRRQRINAISAVSPSGAFWYKAYDGKVNAERFVEFLTEFMKHRKKPVTLIMDSLPAHKSKAVTEFVESLQGKLKTYFLPTYAPDLNPDEFVWNYMKGSGTVRIPLRKGESLKHRVNSQMADIKRNKSLVRSFFRAESVAYTAD